MSSFEGQYAMDSISINRKRKKRHRSEEHESSSGKKRQKLENGNFPVDVVSPPIDSVVSDASVEITSVKRRHRRSQAKAEAAEDYSLLQSTPDDLTKVVAGGHVPRFELGATGGDGSILGPKPARHHHKKHGRAVEKGHGESNDIITIADVDDTGDSCAVTINDDDDGIAVADTTKTKHNRPRQKKDRHPANEFGMDNDVTVAIETSSKSGHHSIYEKAMPISLSQNMVGSSAILLSDDDVTILNNVGDAATTRATHQKHKRRHRHCVESNENCVIVHSGDEQAKEVITIVEVPDQLLAPASSEDETRQRRHRKKHRRDALETCDGTTSDVLVVEEPDANLHRHHQKKNRDDEVISVIVDSGVGSFSEPFLPVYERRKHRSKHHHHIQPSVVVSSQSENDVVINSTDESLGPPPLLSTEALRFQPPSNFVEVEPSMSAQLYWEDVAGRPDKELWIVRAPADCKPSELDRCEAVIGSTICFNRLLVDIQAVDPSVSGSLVVMLPSRQDKKLHVAATVQGLVTVSRNLAASVRSDEPSVPREKKKRKTERSDDR